MEQVHQMSALINVHLDNIVKQEVHLVQHVKPDIIVQKEQEVVQRVVLVSGVLQEVQHVVR